MIGENLNGMAVFARVVEAKSFSGAAATLGLSKSAVSKQISQLEDRLGARLLDRTTRRVALTEVGRVFYDHAARMLQEAESAEAAVASLHELPRGVLRISLPMSFGLTHIAPLIPAFLELCPELRMEMTYSDRYVDLLEEGFDLAIRIARLTDSSLVARRIAPNRVAICGTPEYIKRHGEPKTAQDLSAHSCLSYTYSPDPDQWTLSIDGRLEDVRINSRVRANNGDALRLAALGHQALVMLPTFMVGDDLRAGRLVEVMRGMTPPDSAIYAVYPSRRYLTPKVRAFIDFLIEKFGPEPYWDRA